MTEAIRIALSAPWPDILWSVAPAFLLIAIIGVAYGLLQRN